MKRLTPLLALLATFACAPSEKPADLVILGGRIVTMDSDAPEAEAVAARGGELVAVGTEAEVRRLIGDATEVIDLEDALAVPGLIEGHAHFLSVGRAKMQLDLRLAASYDEIVAMVAEAAAGAEPGRWILGRGWHQEKWSEPPVPGVSGLPYHDALSAVSPDNPVQLTHASGHATMVNAVALEMAGIDDTTPDPPGGEIVRDAGGRAIGVLRETAASLAGSYVDVEQDEALVRRMAELAAEACLAQGITSFQDASVSFAQVEVLRAMAAAGELPVRLWMMLGEANQALAEKLPGYRVHREGEARLTIGGIKRFADGALGSHGAWLLEPYADLPGSVGLNIDTPEVMRETARLAADHGLQLCTHAIGDRANRMTLDVYQEVIDARPDGRELRWRVEHAQHLHPDDIPRFADLGVIAAMQPTHCTSDGPWVVPRLGEQRAEQGAYMWRALLDSGAVIAAGTDAPVEPLDTMPSFHAAVTREMDDGSAFHPRQVMTREEALRAMTLDAAYAAFEEDIKGSLEVGKLADVTVLSKDILTVPEDEVLETRVLYTIVGGVVAYREQP